MRDQGGDAALRQKDRNANARPEAGQFRRSPQRELSWAYEPGGSRAVLGWTAFRQKGWRARLSATPTSSRARGCSELHCAPSQSDCEVGFLAVDVGVVKTRFWFGVDAVGVGRDAS